eukprot:1925629-Karenia_brevis.AAC.1
MAHLGTCSGASQAVSSKTTDESEEKVSAAEVDPVNGQAMSIRARSGVCGITSAVRCGRQTQYTASTQAERLRIESRSVVDLSLALDHLVVLTDIKRRLLVDDGGSFEDRFRREVPAVLHEHKIDADAIGLRFKLQLNLHKEAQGRRAIMYTPVFQFHETELVLHILIYLNDMRKKYSFQDLSLALPSDSSTHAAIIDSIVKEGHGHAGVHGRSIRHSRDLWTLIFAAYEEKLCALWNRRAMAQEERSQRRATKLEKHLQRRNSRALAREDRLSQKWQRHSEGFEDKLVHSISRLLLRWQRIQDKSIRLRARRIIFYSRPLP